MPLSRKIPGMVALGLFLAGCTDNTGPRFPSLAGDYTGSVSKYFYNTLEEGTETGTITLSFNEPDADGDFTGSFTTSGFSNNGSGPLSGFIEEDGDITITQFGDLDQNVDFSYLQDLFWWCELDNVGANSFTGSIDGPNLELNFLESVPCYYGEPATAYTTDIDYDIVASQ